MLHAGCCPRWQGVLYRKYSNGHSYGGLLTPFLAFPPGQIAADVQVTYSIHTVRVELYESAGDYVRLVLEIILSIWVCIQLLSTFWSIIGARRRQVSHAPPGNVVVPSLPDGSGCNLHNFVGCEACS